MYLGSMPEYPEQCSTCGKPYQKPHYDLVQFCSNGFHCCRDCTWVDGRRTVICGPCEALERRWKEEWAQGSSEPTEPSEGL